MKRLAILFAVILFSFSVEGQRVKKRYQNLDKEYLDCQVYDINNKKYWLKKIIDPCKPTLILFFTDWCPPCHKLLTELNSQQMDFKKNFDFELILIAMNSCKNNPKEVNRELLEKNYHQTIFFDSRNDALMTYQVRDIPQVLLIYDNKLLLNHRGYNQELINKITTLMYENYKKLD